MDWKDGCDRAARAGADALERGARAVDAVMEAVVVLEEDGRFNAGRGAYLRLDGKTVEMDAGIMDSAGCLGAVASISRVRNPIRVAREVSTTPHVLLCGPGASAFARKRGFADFQELSATAIERYAKVRSEFRQRSFEKVRDEWKAFDLEANWNFETPYPDDLKKRPQGAGCDTVGAVALSEKGELAAATSTGGVSVMLRGRVGDSPLPGCGYFAGEAAAVSVTGIGEEIIRRMLSKRVYDWVSQGEGVGAACERGVALFPQRDPVGIISISRRGWSISANRPMAAAECVVEGEAS